MITSAVQCPHLVRRESPSIRLWSLRYSCGIRGHVLFNVCLEWHYSVDSARTSCNSRRRRHNHDPDTKQRHILVWVYFVPGLPKITVLQHRVSPLRQVLTGKPPYSEFKRDAQVVVAISLGTQPSRPKFPVIIDRHWSFILDCWSTKDCRPSSQQVDEYIKGQLYLLQHETSSPD
jgi:hypothetical protein